MQPPQATTDLATLEKVTDQLDPMAIDELNFQLAEQATAKR